MYTFLSRCNNMPFTPFTSPGNDPLYCEAISTGSLRLDATLAIGGIPAGHITEVFGPESSGKTTLILHVLASGQRDGKLAALIDSDHALDPVYARRCGIDSQQLYICQPGDAEQALSICSSLIKSGSFSAIAIDSATALLPLEEAALDYGASYAKYQQQLLDHAIPSLAISALKTGTALIFSNQLRIHSGSVYHQRPSSTAVLALKLHSALRLELINLKNIYDHGEIVGNRVQVKVAKNKFANSATPTRIDILYNEGIDCAGEILDLAVDFLICHRSGNSYFYGSQSLGDSRRSAKDFLLQNTAIAREIELAVRQRLFPGSREEYLEK